MKAKYSKTTGGIYPTSAFKTFPDDALDIPDALYARFTSAEISRFDVVDGKVVEYVAPPPTPLTASERKVQKQKEIDAIEESQYMTRGEREGWLAMIEAQATSQSVSLNTLYVANPFYKKLKDIDEQVTVLRADLKAIS